MYIEYSTLSHSVNFFLLNFHTRTLHQSFSCNYTPLVERKRNNTRKNQTFILTRLGFCEELSLLAAHRLGQTTAEHFLYSSDNCSQIDLANERQHFCIEMDGCVPCTQVHIELREGADILFHLMWTHSTIHLFQKKRAETCNDVSTDFTIDQERMMKLTPG